MYQLLFFLFFFYTLLLTLSISTYNSIFNRANIKYPPVNSSLFEYYHYRNQTANCHFL